MTAEELAALKPGDRVRYVPSSRGRRRVQVVPGWGVVTLSHRKEDGSGWWNTDGTGLDDKLALLSDTWEVVR